MSLSCSRLPPTPQPWHSIKSFPERAATKGFQHRIVVLAGGAWSSWSFIRSEWLFSGNSNAKWTQLPGWTCKPALNCATWAGMFYRKEHVASVEGPCATRDVAPPGTGPAATPSPSAEKIHTSSTSSCGTNRVHLPDHILTDTTNRYLGLGDSVQSCCPGLEPSPRLLVASPWPYLHPALLLPSCTGTPGARLSRCCCPTSSPSTPWVTPPALAAPCLASAPNTHAVQQLLPGAPT